MRVTASWSHDALAEDLALSLGVLPYLNVVLGSQWPGARGRRLEDIHQLQRGNSEDWFTRRSKAARVFGEDVGKLVAMVSRLGGFPHGGWKRGLERAMELLKKQGWAA